MFVLAEGGFGFDAIDIPAGGYKHGFDVAAIFLVVDGGETLPDGAIGNFLGDTFKDDSFVSLLSANRAVGVRGDVLCFARVRAGAESERIFPPDTPN